MKKITSEYLPIRLAQYSALSIAIAGVADANGQIIYTDIIGDINGTLEQLYELDLNNDGIKDFRVIDRSIDPSHGFLILNNGPLAPFGSYPALPSLNNNSFLGSMYGASFFPFALSFSAMIGASQTSWYSLNPNSMPPHPDGFMNFNNCLGGGGYSNWCGVVDKYLGLRFQVGGMTHYGWARMDVNPNEVFWVVKDYAYESSAGVAIAAGDNGVLGVEDSEFNNVKIISLNKSIALYNLNGNTNYNLFSITGQSVLKGSTDLDTYVIEANTLARGVYILELKGTDSNAVIRKKVTL